MKKPTTTAVTDTARDEWSVLAALGRPDLYKPSLDDIADVIQVIENKGHGRPATLAWLLSRSPETLHICQELKRCAEEAGTLTHRGNGVLIGALCDRDLAALIDSPDEMWIQPEEVNPEGCLLPERLSAMLKSRIEQAKDDETRAKLERVLAKLREHQERERLRSRSLKLA